jgi:hypothetical protein
MPAQRQLDGSANQHSCRSCKGGDRLMNLSSGLPHPLVARRLSQQEHHRREAQT